MISLRPAEVCRIFHNGDILLLRSAAHNERPGSQAHGPWPHGPPARARCGPCISWVHVAYECHGFHDCLELNEIRSGFSPGNAPGNQPWSPWQFSQGVLNASHDMFLRKQTKNNKMEASTNKLAMCTSPKEGGESPLTDGGHHILAGPKAAQ
jgi:hypothetical protein